jgi:hypothetical protein
MGTSIDLSFLLTEKPGATSRFGVPCECDFEMRDEDSSFRVTGIFDACGGTLFDVNTEGTPTSTESLHEEDRWLTELFGAIISRKYSMEIFPGRRANVETVPATENAIVNASIIFDRHVGNSLTHAAISPYTPVVWRPTLEP